MPLTNRSRLQPGPPPDVPPWRWLDPRTLQRWLKVSSQTLVNWRARCTGPLFRIAENGRVWYRFADVQAWLDEADADVARQMIIHYLDEHAIQWALLGFNRKLTASDQAKISKLVMKAATDLPALTDAELEMLCNMIDQHGSSAPLPRRQRPKRFIENTNSRQFIGYAA